MFTLLCGDFIQDTTCQILSELSEFCTKYDKNISAYFSVHSVCACTFCN